MDILKNWTQKRKTILWMGALLAAAAIVGFSVRSLLIQEEAAAQTSVQVAAVTRGSIMETVEAVGVLESQPSAVLTWESGGIVDEISVQVGDEVAKGNVLLELMDDSKSPEILQAENSLLEAQMELGNLLATDSDLQAILKEIAYQELMLIHKYNARNAWNYGGSSDARIDAALADYRTAERNVWELEDAYQAVKILEKDDPQRTVAYEALQAGIRNRDILLRALNQILGHSFDHDVETSFIVYDQQVALVAMIRASYDRALDESEEIAAARAVVQSLQNTVNQGSIIAPFDGTVTEIFNFAGEGVTAGTQAVHLDNLYQLVVEIDIPQLDINKVHAGQSARITFSALPGKEYEGFVQTVSEAGTDASGQVTFRVVIRMEDADEKINPGFTALVRIITAQAEDALLVPNQAIVTTDAGASAVILTGADGSVQLVQVEIGARSDAFTEILSDSISEGSQVAVIPTGASNLETNMGALMFMMNPGPAGGRPPEGEAPQGGGGESPP